MSFTVEGQVKIPEKDFWNFVQENATDDDGNHYDHQGTFEYIHLNLFLNELIVDVIDKQTHTVHQSQIYYTDITNFWNFVESYSPFTNCGAETLYGPPHLDYNNLVVDVIASDECNPRDTNGGSEIIEQWDDLGNVIKLKRVV